MDLIDAICQGEIEQALQLIPFPYQESTEDDGSGLTPLHHAVQHQQYTIVIYLLAAGANPEALSEDGIHPLELAETLGHAAIAELIRRAIRADD